MIKQGYTSQEIWNAMQNAMKQPYHVENNFVHLTLEFFTRPTTIDKYGTISEREKPTAKTTIQDPAHKPGTPSISGALNQFGEIWNTIVINCYGDNSTVLDAMAKYVRFDHPRRASMMNLPLPRNLERG